MNRITLGNTFSFEELVTLVAQIEAVMNDSGLLCYRVSTGDLIEVLTPAHFLVGSTLNEVPAFKNLKISFEYRWDEMRKLMSQF